MRRLPALAVALLFLGIAAPARAHDYKDADFTQAFIPSSDGVKLHADVLRPKGLPKDAKTPVIVSVGPYFNHSGQVGPAGPTEDTQYDPVGPNGESTPSERFADFIEGTDLFKRGYSFVMVDLRGFGGSSGCLDWAGPGEQSDVKNAVEWAASQSWSTGSVGMYGKSYDGVTGLIGEVANPRGLKAVVSMEPVYDLYRYLYANGVRYENASATPALYDAIAASPGPLLDDPMQNYNTAGATTPDCLASNYASQQDSNHDSDYWKARNLIAKAPQGRTPLFLTQGFLENNTKPDGAWDFYNALNAPKRAWFGMWDHVRGNEVVGGTGADKDRLKEGRKGYFDEVMRFYDHYLMGKSLADAPTDKDPANAVQTSDGTWRAETSWPPADSTMDKVTLTPGVYNGTGQNDGTGSQAGGGIWTISPPLDHDAWYSGVPKANLALVPSGQPNAGVVVDTYDIDAQHSAILLSRQTSLVPADGKVSLDLYGNDWKIPAGHRLGVLVTDTNEEWWLPAAPSVLTLKSGTVDLPFLMYKRPDTIQGDPSVRLEEWLKDAPFTIPADTIAKSTVAGFALPAAMTDAPAGTLPTAGSSNPTITGTAPTAKARLKVRIRRHKRRIVVTGTAPRGVRVHVKLTRFGKRVRSRAAKTSATRFRITFKVRRSGRYRAVVRVRTGGRTLHRRTKRVRVR